MICQAEWKHWFKITDAGHTLLCNRFAGKKVAYRFNCSSAVKAKEGIGQLTFYSKRLSRIWLDARLAMVNADGNTVEWALFLPPTALQKLRPLPDGAEGPEFALELPWSVVIEEDSWVSPPSVL